MLSQGRKRGDVSGITAQDFSQRRVGILDAAVLDDTNARRRPVAERSEAGLAGDWDRLYFPVLGADGGS
jgi:hypothetical protein